MVTKLTINLSQAIILATATLLACINFACNSSSLTNIWKDPEFNNPPMTNMLIIAAKKEPVKRRIWEDVITSELTVYSVKSTPSYRLFPDSIPDPNQVGAAVQEKKFDGVFFIRKLPTRISTSYVPGPVKTEKVTQYDEHTRTYSTIYRDVQQPGYTDTTKIVRHEVSIFATEDGGRLVWAGTGELINPNNREEIKSEIAHLVIPELARYKIISEK
jgi:hypothetical protein